MPVWDHVYRKVVRAMIPIGVHIDLTYRCHHRCHHCYIPREWRQGQGPGPELATAQVKDLLEQLAAAGTFFLTFSGGEVFFRADLFELLEYARKLNFSINLFTSGTKDLSLERIKALAEIGIEALMVSLYSLEAEVHDSITGIPGSWVKVWRTINQCFDVGLRVGLNCPILEANSPGLAALQEFAHRKDISLRLDSDIVPCWDSRSPCLGTYFAKDTDKVRSNKPPKALETPFFTDRKMIGCGAAISSCYITPLGNLWPCLDVSLDCGSVLNHGGFNRIWHESLELAQVRRLQKKMGELDKKLCEVLRQPQAYKTLFEESAL